VTTESLEPSYEAFFNQQLDTIEKDGSRIALWHAVCDAIDLCCDHPGSAAARYETVRRSEGRFVFQVPIRTHDNWVLWWRPEPPDAIFVYLGPRIT
jgi:hypothetical protein